MSRDAKCLGVLVLLDARDLRGRREPSARSPPDDELEGRVRGTLGAFAHVRGDRVGHHGAERPVLALRQGLGALERRVLEVDGRSHGPIRILSGIMMQWVMRYASMRLGHTGLPDPNGEAFGTTTRG